MIPGAESRRRARRGWLALAALTVCAAAFTAVDSALKRTTYTGYVLPDAEFAFAAEDLPRAWMELETSDAFQRISEEAPQVYQRIFVRLRRETGIRWTPRRWSLWFGRPFAFSRIGDEWVASARPGLLLRAAHAGGLLGPSTMRDGHLIFGGSDRIVARLAEAGVAVPKSGLDRTVGVQWSAAPPGELRIEFKDALTFEGSIALESRADSAESQSIRRVDDWPGSPALSLYVANAQLLDDILPESWPEFPFSAELRSAWDDFLERLPDDWSGGEASRHFALVTVDTRGAVPIPEIGLIIRPANPLGLLAMPLDGIPYIWGVTSGWMQPWLGEPVSLYAAGGPRIRVFANQEPTMAHVLDRPMTGRIVSQDLRLRADLTQLSIIGKALARSAAEQELLPGRDKDDVEWEIAPWLTAAGALGRLRVDGRVVGSRLDFSGAFDPPPPKAVDSE